VNCPCLKVDVEVELEVEEQGKRDKDHASWFKKKLGKTLH